MNQLTLAITLSVLYYLLTEVNEMLTVCHPFSVPTGLSDYITCNCFDRYTCIAAGGVIATDCSN